MNLKIITLSKRKVHVIRFYLYKILKIANCSDRKAGRYFQFIEVCLLYLNKAVLKIKRHCLVFLV